VKRGVRGLRRCVKGQKWQAREIIIIYIPRYESRLKSPYISEVGISEASHQAAENMISAGRKHPRPSTHRAYDPGQPPECDDLSLSVKSPNRRERVLLLNQKMDAGHIRHSTLNIYIYIYVYTLSRFRRDRSHRHCYCLSHTHLLPTDYSTTISKLAATMARMPRRCRRALSTEPLRTSLYIYLYI
jgi:hypothetical protein